MLSEEKQLELLIELEEWSNRYGSDKFFEALLVDIVGNMASVNAMQLSLYIIYCKIFAQLFQCKYLAQMRNVDASCDGNVLGAKVFL